MFTVYMIRSDEGKQYIGHTSDIHRRLAEHNTGLCKTTKVCGEWKLVYKEEFATRGEAMKREKWLKSGVGRAYLKQVLNF
ncbi:MAG: GIY-YIG nuclease family protein [Candidatus Zixiibacteriota bacterium]